MKEKKTKNYEPPQVEVIEVEVEKGFAGSTIGGQAVNEGMVNPGGGSYNW